MPVVVQSFLSMLVNIVFSASIFSVSVVMILSTLIFKRIFVLSPFLSASFFVNYRDSANESFKPSNDISVQLNYLNLFSTRDRVRGDKCTAL